MRIRIPSGMDPNDFSAAIRAIDAAGAAGIPENDGTGYAVEWDTTKAPLPTDRALRDAVVGRRRGLKIAEARVEGKRRRVELSPVPVDEVDFFLADVMVRQYEVARGRANQQEESAVESLVSRLKQMRAVKTAEDTIVAEIEASDDPASYDVPNSPHWPRITP